MVRLVSGLVALAALGVGTSATSAGPTWRAHGVRAAADAQVSSNWAGYAVTGTRPDGTPVEYTNVVGSWVQPKINCKLGESYAAFWVGLGGFTDGSTALEQVGTESHCTSSRKAVYAAWYEIIPDPSIPIRMKIRPGDRITAAVLVQATRVILQLTNRTTGMRVTRRVTVEQPDLASAEWIAEAPSECSSAGFCQTLPLADFGRVSFAAAAATGDGHAGTISDPAWAASPIELAERDATQLDPAAGGGAGGTGSGAVPGALSADGRGFSVSWHAAR